MRGGSRVRCNRKSIETLSKCARLCLGKPKPIWSCIWQGSNRYISSERKSRSNISLLLIRAGNVVTENTEKTLVFTAKTHLWESQVPETHRKVWSKEELPSVDEDQIGEYLKKLNVHKFMEPEHPSMLLELENVIAKPLSIIF